MNDAMTVAKERQLEWLLDEAFGDRRSAPPQDPELREVRSAFPWLAAALALLAVGAAIGVGWLREEAAPVAEPQDKNDDAPWHECHGRGELELVPVNVVRLRCFDFDDADCAQLTRFARLEELDLSGADAAADGAVKALAITDDGVRSLAPLVRLRWLCLAHCRAMRGEPFALSASWPIEHLDLRDSGVETLAIEGLGQFPRLHTLVLSQCLAFDRHALRVVTSMPALRRIELQGCTQLAASDLASLANARGLRWIDVRDCAGEASPRIDLPGLAPTEPAKEPRMGVTGDVVAALSTLPLTGLLLGGCTALNSSIGDDLARLETLQVLDLARLPRVHDVVLPRLSASLQTLSLAGDSQMRPTLLPPLPQLRRLDLRGVGGLGIPDLRRVLEGRAIEELSLGDTADRVRGLRVSSFGPGIADVLVASPSLRRLRFEMCGAIGGAELARLATMPRLEEIDLSGTTDLGDDDVVALAASRSVHTLRHVGCERVTGWSLENLVQVPLRELDLRGTKCDPARVRALATKNWPHCLVVLPNGQRFRAP